MTVAPPLPPLPGLHVWNQARPPHTSNPTVLVASARADALSWCDKKTAAANRLCIAFHRAAQLRSAVASAATMHSAKVMPAPSNLGTLAIEKVFSVGKDIAAHDHIVYTVAPREWLAMIGLAKVGKEQVSFGDLLEAEGLLNEDFSGIKFLTPASLRELGLRYGEIKAFQEALEDIHKIQAGKQVSSLVMNWKENEPKPSVATNHKSNYKEPLEIGGETGLMFHHDNPYGLRLANRNRVGGKNWATFPRDRMDSVEPQQVSGVVLLMRFNMRAIYAVETEKQQFGAHFIMEAFLDMSLHPGLTNADGSQLNPSTWEPRLHFTNIVSTERWECRPTILLNTEDDSICSIRYKYTIRAVFSESMELQNFPFDVQALHLSLYSKRANGEVTLCALRPDKHTFQVYNMPEINTFDPLPMHGSDKFNGGGEYLACKSTNSLVSQSSRGRVYPVLHVYCAVQRRSGYYIVNIAVPAFIITAISFMNIEYGIDDEYDSLSPRMDVSLGLLLTVVAFKYSVATDLPNVAYLTAMDHFLVITYVVLALTCVHSVAIHAAFRVNVQEPRMGETNTTELEALDAQETFLESVDVWVGVAIAVIYSIFSLVWLAVGCACKGQRALKEVQHQFMNSQGFLFAERRGSMMLTDD